MNTPVDLRLAPVAAGTWVACYVGITHPNATGVLLGAALALGVGLMCWPRKRARHRTVWRGWVSLTLLLGVVAFVGAGASTALHVSHRQDSLDSILGVHNGANITLRVTADVHEGAAGPGVHGVLTSVRTSGHRLRTSVPVYVLDADERWRVGMTLTVRGTLTQGTGQRAFLRIADHQAEAPPRGLYGFVDRLREGVRTASNHLPPHARGLLPGVSIGDDRRLPDHVQEAMRTTSLTHITAVSGAHVAIVLGSVMFVLGPAPRVFKAAAAALVLATMVIVVLPTPSVLRASGMGALTIIALGSKRPRLALPILFFTATVLLLWDPWLATSIGFALSTCATLGIVVMTEPLARLGGGGPLARALAVPTAAQMWCAPLLLTFDASIATYAIPANLLALPALAPATISALLSAVLSLFTPAGAQYAVSLGQYFTAWIVTIAVFFAELPASRLPWIPGPGGAALLIVTSATLVGAFWVMRRDRTWQA